MKRIIFGATSAFLVVVGFSSLNTAKKFAISYYWFFTQYQAGLVITGFDHFAQAPSLPCTGGLKFCEVAYTVGQVHTDGLGVVTSVKSGQTNLYKVAGHRL